MVTKKCEGYTLIIVLWVMVIMGVIFANLVDEVSINSMLVTDAYDEQKARQAALSGVIVALDKLKNDNNEFDLITDKWNQVLNIELAKVDCEVETRDIGSRLNINYTDEDLLLLLKLDDQFYSRIEEGVIPDLIFLKQLAGKDYEKVNKFFTVYGKFNINNDSIEGLEKLLKFLGLRDALITVICNGLQEFRQKKESLTILEELPLKIEGLNMSIYRKIEPYLTVNGTININFAAEEVLDLIFKYEDIDSEYVSAVTSYCKEIGIKELADLDKVLPESAFNKVEGYFTTKSNFFQISSTAIIPNSKQGIRVIAEVKRDYSDEKCTIKVMKWSETEVTQE